MNTFGFYVGLVTLLVIGLGFVWVIRGERYLGYLWWPYFLGAGILLVVVSLFISNDWVSVIAGVVGGSLIWGSTSSKSKPFAQNWDGIHSTRKRSDRRLRI